MTAGVADGIRRQGTVPDKDLHPDPTLRAGNFSDSNGVSGFLTSIHNSSPLYYSLLAPRVRRNWSVLFHLLSEICSHNMRKAFNLLRIDKFLTEDFPFYGQIFFVTDEDAQYRNA